MARVLTSHQYDPGSIPAWYHMWVESRIVLSFFLWVLQFFLHRNQHLQIVTGPVLFLRTKTSQGPSLNIVMFILYFIF